MTFEAQTLRTKLTSSRVYALVAQWIEQRFPKPCVAGSIPAGGTISGPPSYLRLSRSTSGPQRVGAQASLPTVANEGGDRVPFPRKPIRGE
jgi:hypothetical protein